jgi:hypothetical protein
MYVKSSCPPTVPKPPSWRTLPGSGRIIGRFGLHPGGSYPTGFNIGARNDVSTCNGKHKSGVLADRDPDSLLSSCVVSSGLSYAPVRIGARSKETELRNK